MLQDVEVAQGSRDNAAQVLANLARVSATLSASLGSWAHRWCFSDTHMSIKQANTTNNIPLRSL